MENSESVAEFLARGGKVIVVEEGKKADKPEFACDCGCEGDYTDHQMRKGERGQ